jgi:hypothetical protein
MFEDEIPEEIEMSKVIAYSELGSKKRQKAKYSKDNLSGRRIDNRRIQCCSDLEIMSTSTPILVRP